MILKSICFFAIMFCFWQLKAQTLISGTVMSEAYQKLWNPTIQAKIDEGIERNRKGEANLEILDKDGRPLKEVAVSIQQKSHDFLFGCNLFVLGQLQTPELNIKYETAFANLFNFATIPFYWGGIEPQQGKPRFEEGSSLIWRRPPPDQLLNWCKSHNIIAKGHALMYVMKPHMPEWIEQDDLKLFMQQAHEHIKGIANRYRSEIQVWDVANEEMARINHLNQWHKVPDDYLAWCFEEAGSLFPNDVMLLYNDGTSEVHDHTEEYMALIQNLLDKKLRIEGMGVQFHLGNAKQPMLDGKVYTPDFLFNVYDKLNKFDLPVFITEITIPGNGENGVAIQAEIIKNLYRLWFSIARMAGITWWNLGDQTATDNENKWMGGLLDAKMNPKPAYEILDRLINHEWKTNLKISSGSHGNVSFRGFYGKYKITVSHNGKSIEQEINLSQTGNNKFVIQL